ncbi:DNA-binding transcriptional MerR regulator [Stackebrandtia albiflava]|uniref:DNA-binding transcriptional MerR regulator n=1 Tax=Stackebrandtia albiflava TaxID=406432 RepID=A0A562VD70_9ACTN|nr:MerR family transcriptional regulator [Stackebrandtia albiflava]TWJ15761.1 DNA-binding transcriptional MerR regulator [Stackebrandtia albiflava]
MTDDDLLLPGEFGRLTWLSPKALRLYAARGLLPPRRIDPATGYRRYGRDQIPRARRIAMLRRMEVPLDRLEPLLDLPPERLPGRLRELLHDRAARLRRHAEVVEDLARGVESLEDLTARVALRDVPGRKLLAREIRVRVSALDEAVTTTERALRRHLEQVGAGDDAPLLVFFHGLVTEDGDGPVEIAIPFTGVLEPVDDLRIRWAAPHREAFIAVTGEERAYPHVMSAYDAVACWVTGRPGLALTGSPLETYTDGGASMDVAFPVVETEG